ncbi:hypothetical protein [Cupriavidus necator]
MQPTLGRHVHAPRGVLHMAFAGQAAEWRGADTSGAGSVADIPVWHRK